MSRTVIESIEGEYRRYYKYAVDSIAQLDGEMINAPGPGGNNSIAVIIQHVSGNLRSRFTNFLTTDGEKPDRNRDAEFDEPRLTPDSAQALWKRGFDILSPAGRFTQSWTISSTPPRLVNACSCHSSWTTPDAAVIHCTSPGPILP